MSNLPNVEDKQLQEKKMYINADFVDYWIHAVTKNVLMNVNVFFLQSLW